MSEVGQQLKLPHARLSGPVVRTGSCSSGFRIERFEVSFGVVARAEEKRQDWVRGFVTALISHHVEHNDW